jgi:hypothetical protein
VLLVDWEDRLYTLTGTPIGQLRGASAVLGILEDGTLVGVLPAGREGARLLSLNNDSIDTTIVVFRFASGVSADARVWVETMTWHKTSGLAFVVSQEAPYQHSGYPWLSIYLLRGFDPKAPRTDAPQSVDIAGRGEGSRTLVWAPDGTKLAYWIGGWPDWMYPPRFTGIQITHLGGGHRQIFAGYTGKVAWSPSGEEIARFFIDASYTTIQFFDINYAAGLSSIK